MNTPGSSLQSTSCSTPAPSGDRPLFSSLVPFSGFYCSWHDSAIGQAEEQMFSDDSDNLLDNLHDIFFCHTNFRSVHERYAENYVSILRDKLSLPSLAFEELVCPRFYNFETDRIFASVSSDDLAKMLRAVLGPRLDAKLRKLFTSHSGFIPSYPNSLALWPDTDQWDHNHVGAIMEAYADSIAEADGSTWDSIEESIAADHSSTGDLEDWLYRAADFTGQAAADLASIKRRLQEESPTSFHPSNR